MGKVMRQRAKQKRTLTEQQKTFAEHYFTYGEKYAAALYAGYSEHSHKSVSRRLLKKPQVKAYLQYLRKKHIKNVPPELIPDRQMTDEERQEFEIPSVTELTQKILKDIELCEHPRDKWRGYDMIARIISAYAPEKVEQISTNIDLTKLDPNEARRLTTKELIQILKESDELSS